jgi:redox-sensitive bicupin YhaK (pirin superfamily)
VNERIAVSDGFSNLDAGDALVSAGSPLDLELEESAPRITTLGAMTIRRALPVRHRRMVGPWCFLDRYGPLSFTNEKPMDVAPHPHIGLQTVSWLLDGEVIHNDSMGYEGLIRPGELNLMTAGRGVAHTEETPTENTGRLSGVQLWVALPDAHRHDAPSFHQYSTLPMFDLPGGHATLIMGEWAGHASPAAAYSLMFGAEMRVYPAGHLIAPLRADYEHALVVLDGDVSTSNRTLTLDSLYYLKPGRTELNLRSNRGARVMLLGGVPFGETILMWWNFVARTAEEIQAARENWQQHRFAEVPTYQGPRTEAPDLVFRPVAR